MWRSSISQTFVELHGSCFVSAFFFCKFELQGFAVVMFVLVFLCSLLSVVVLAALIIGSAVCVCVLICCCGTAFVFGFVFVTGGVSFSLSPGLIIIADGK